MANALYPSIKSKMLTGAFNWTTNPVVVILIATGRYTFSPNHATLLDVPALARVATSAVLTGKTVTVNAVDADDYLFASVSGPPVNAVIFAVDSGSPATSWLICYLDTMTGVPFSPSTSAVQLTWNNSADKIFAL